MPNHTDTMTKINELTKPLDAAIATSNSLRGNVDPSDKKYNDLSMNALMSLTEVCIALRHGSFQEASDVIKNATQHQVKLAEYLASKDHSNA